MSYQVLARKWRPHHFKDVVGQPHVLTALENALDHNRLHHAYLFSGTRGVGKTTIARLFAKGLNCEEGITSTPCGVCSTCKEIDEGRFVDLLEIDAASRTKVEDTRELLDNVQYKPARGRFKVYLIDEVHMLSRHSFNALLKTLEEPPEYVKFLLATTDPQKLPVTILSRCLQFHLKHISVDQIHEQLDFVLDKEEVTKDARALGLIAHAADGSMRDALSLTDQAIALGNGSVTTDIVSAMLGTLDTDQAVRILEAISTKNMQTLMSCVNDLADMGIEWDGLAKEIANQLHKLAMYQALPATLDKTQPDAERIELLSGQLSPQEVQLFYQIALQSRKDLPLAPTEKTGVEMMLLRMVAFRPVHAQQLDAQPIAVPSTEPQVVQPMAMPRQQSAPLVDSNPATMRPQTPVQRQASQIAQPQQANTQNQYVPPVESEQPPMYDAPPMGDSHQSMQQTSSSVPPVQQEPAVAPKTGLLGVRNQLRSAKNNLANTNNGTGSKKSSAASDKKKTSSVLERIAEKQHLAPRAQVSQIGSSAAQEKKPEEPYRWKSTQPEQKKVVSDITPTKLKQALEHEKTPEMVKLLVEESSKQDEWSALAMSLTLPKLVQQLVLNSSFVEKDNQVTLHLRAAQSHLNGDKANELVAQALSQALNKDITVLIDISTEGTTPLELREQMYQTKLQTAYQSLQQDPHVNFFIQRFGAEMDQESVRPI
ncbi:MULTISPECIES: DNA polymerase III subunit gamma/tau [Aliivibrio]|uniref:DNA polymerase III subunit gamma/tau n=1 Tax=Aliivibrio finisterrensis TaxID=511998 RepID=A0A4Q5KWC3_9GAMM|nr:MULTISPECIES: DNA polymerase III subunit gamma/tau [Aliivibrio]MDD9179069.1 DNA polymerase III subunit gamma/tau [Aliivibrio sp. A6]RYU51533.1 DNA polymerase III subunit gamma/tau [Aliivibrio finisterrensis]RYU52758.1 DNA polymerase III subunit gamma/tau [Aliivibrio finisterrensis]RYU58256.1 DNA polymerase III subunit gamma/tau [Aliivibrio finisterrensis]RYU64072.1 DNA polymerase III subunit gamma/tau [Aliivibrio finisterrensis]